MSSSIIIYAILAIIVILTISLIFLVDNFIGRLINWIFSLFGSFGGESSVLSVSSEIGEDEIILTIKNEGKHNIKLAAVEGLNLDDSKFYPIPYFDKKEFKSITEKELRNQFANKSLNPKQTLSVFLNKGEIDYTACLGLNVLDASGNAWDAKNFNQLIEVLRKHGGKTAEELKAEGK